MVSNSLNARAFWSVESSQKPASLSILMMSLMPCGVAKVNGSRVSNSSAASPEIAESTRSACSSGGR
eukprot:7871673-Alexandrium_andersonii.AAC.1